MKYEDLKRIACYCVTSGTQNTTNGKWSISYDELSHHFGVDKTDINGNVQLLTDMLNQQEEINDLMMTEDCIEMTYHMEHCPLCQQGGIKGAPALASVIGCNISDEHTDEPTNESRYTPMSYAEVEVKLAKHTLWLFSGEGEQAVFSHCLISNQNFVARDFPNIIFDHCRFEDDNFNMADLSHSIFNDCDFDDCDLSYVTATGADFSGTDFGNSNLDEADFDTCNMKEAKMENIHGAYTRLQFCCIEDAYLGDYEETVIQNECWDDEAEWKAEFEGEAMEMQV